MSAAGQHPVPAPCPRGCGGYGDAHKLTCPVLQLAGRRLRCVYCGRWSCQPGWGCAFCGTCTVEDLAAITAREAVAVPP